MRKLLSTLAIASVGVFLSLQPAAAQGLGIGAEAGVNVSDLSIQDEGEEVATGTETGFRIGGVLRWSFGPVFGFQTGASFSQKGAVDESTGTGPEETLEFEYLEVPLLLNVDIPTGPAPVSPRIYAGGTVNFELSCEITETGEPAESCDAPTADVVETKSTDFGLLFGGGLDFAAGPGSVTVDVRYDLGLTDIADDAADLLELKNRNFQATAGYVVSVP